MPNKNTPLSKRLCKTLYIENLVKQQFLLKTETGNQSLGHKSKSSQ